MLNLFFFICGVLFFSFSFCFIMAAPGLECENCGSRKTYQYKYDSWDTHRRNIVHVREVRYCLKCRHEECLDVKDEVRSERAL